ncbi:hypothetical protein ACSBR2_041115 [Camellia fascicularis]
MFSVANLVVANASKAVSMENIMANEAVQDQLSALNFTSLAVIFGAGLVTSLSPCTLSVLLLTLGYIGNKYLVLNFVILGLAEIIQELLAQGKAKQRSLGTRLHFHWDWLLRWQSLVYQHHLLE